MTNQRRIKWFTNGRQRAATEKYIYVKRLFDESLCRNEQRSSVFFVFMRKPKVSWSERRNRVSVHWARRCCCLLFVWRTMTKMTTEKFFSSNRPSTISALMDFLSSEILSSMSTEVKVPMILLDWWLNQMELTNTDIYIDHYRSDWCSPSLDLVEVEDTNEICLCTESTCSFRSVDKTDDRSAVNNDDDDDDVLCSWWVSIRVSIRIGVVAIRCNYVRDSHRF